MKTAVERCTVGLIVGKKKKSKDEEKKTGFQVVCENRRARHLYHVIEKFEAGIVLTGNEIKSIRNRGISLDEAYVRPERGEIFLQGAHIKEYAFSSVKEYNPTRPRKLLLHKREIELLQGRVEAKGMTVVPLRMYINAKGKAKLEIALAKGKDNPDKKKDVMAREKKREAERAIKERR